MYEAQNRKTNHSFRWFTDESQSQQPIEITASELNRASEPDPILYARRKKRRRKRSWRTLRSFHPRPTSRRSSSPARPRSPTTSRPRRRTRAGRRTPAQGRTRPRRTSTPFPAFIRELDYSASVCDLPHVFLIQSDSREPPRRPGGPWAGSATFQPPESL